MGLCIYANVVCVCLCVFVGVLRASCVKTCQVCSIVELGQQVCQEAAKLLVTNNFNIGLAHVFLVHVFPVLKLRLVRATIVIFSV